jgi:recombinational DNA repair protein RecR
MIKEDISEGALKLFKSKETKKSNDWFVTKQEYNDRLNTCKSCENLSMLGQCKICSCFMRLKAKFSNSSCPIDKWKISNNQIKDDPSLNQE